MNIMLLGDFTVGKSSLISNMRGEKLNEKKLLTTAVDYLNLTYQPKTGEDGQQRPEVGIKVWDTAGQERFRTLTTTFYKQADGIVIVFAKNDLDTFLGVNQWIYSIFQFCDEAKPMILVGNKCDLPDAAVTREMGQSLADKYKIEYIETSSEDNLATT